MNENQKLGPTGLSENVAAALSYLLCFITGIIFLLVDKREFVRFHAAQSTVFFVLAALLIQFLPLTIVGVIFVPFLGLLAFLMWIVFMLKAYQGERFKFPWVANWAEKLLSVVKS